MKDTFVLYSNYYDILKDLSDEDLGMIFRATLHYSKTNECIELPPHINLAFNFIKNQLDLDEKKYNEKIEKLRANGKKGGLKKANLETDETDETGEANQAIAKIAKPNEANQAIAKFAKHNVNENENVNENVNDNVLSLYNGEKEKNDKNEREMNKISQSEEKISKEEREILENYIERKKLATKNVRAYASRIVENGDYIRLLDDIRKEKEAEDRARAEKIQMLLDEIHDKYSAAMTLGKSYYKFGMSPPSEFNEIIEKYDLGSYEKCADYVTEVNEKRKKEEESRPTGRIKYINGTYVYVPNCEEEKEE